MAKARAEITLIKVIDISSATRYYLLQSSTLSAPSKPIKNPPTGWSTTEPTYSAGSTNSLYTVELTVFSDGTWSYSDVSLSSSYEAAKTAYNKAQNAADSVNNLSISGRNLFLGTENCDGDAWKGKGVATYFDADASITFHKLVVSESSAWVRYIAQNITVVEGKSYIASALVRKNTDEDVKIRFRFDSASKNSAITITSNEWARVEFSPITATSNCVEYIVFCGYIGQANDSDDNSVDIAYIMVEEANKASAWSPAPEDTQKTIKALQDTNDSLIQYASRDENIIVNGDGSYNDLTAWNKNKDYTGESFDNTDVPDGCYGSFYQAYTDYYPFSFSNSEIYDVSFWAKNASDSTEKAYFSIKPYLRDKRAFASSDVQYVGLTKLAKDLNSGDTILYAEDLSEWNIEKANSSSYWRYVGFHNYTDSTGYTYPVGIAWKRVTFSNGSAINKTDNTVTLSSAWKGDTVPAGTYIAQHYAGEAYIYVGLRGVKAPDDWTYYTATLSADTDIRLKYAKYLVFNYGYNTIAKIAGLTVKRQAVTNAQLAETNKAVDKAQSTADGKNSVYYQSTKPSSTGNKINDIWFDTSNDCKMYYWDGSDWKEKQFGTSAIANLAITNALIKNLDAAKIVTGYLDAARIAAESITAEKLDISDLSALKANIANWIISTYQIYLDLTELDMGYAGLNADGFVGEQDPEAIKKEAVFFVGAKSMDGGVTASSCNFAVTPDGRIYSKKLNISGGVDFGSYTLIDDDGTRNFAMLDDFDDSGWITPTLNEGATQSSVAPVQYRKKNGVVYVVGEVALADATSSTYTLFTLPSGYRPQSRVIHVNTATGRRISRWYVNTAGEVDLSWIVNISDGSSATGELSWVAINISFPV